MNSSQPLWSRLVLLILCLNLVCLVLLVYRAYWGDQWPKPAEPVLDQAGAVQDPYPAEANAQPRANAGQVRWGTDSPRPPAAVGDVKEPPPVTGLPSPGPSSGPIPAPLVATALVNLRARASDQAQRAGATAG